jgi:hypothetical protein
MEFLSILMLFLLFFISLLALLFVIIGEWLIGKLPAVRKIREAHKRWGVLIVGNNIPTGGLSLNQLGLRRVEELILSACEDEVKNKRFGDVVTVVSYKEKHLHHLTREIKTYSYLFIILAGLGGLMNADQFIGKTYSQIGEIILSHHFVPVFEVVMIAYMSIRLFAEAQSINNLLDGE